MKYADVIYEHLLRKNRGCVGTSGPVSADSDIEYQEELILEFTECSGRDIDHVAWALVRHRDRASAAVGVHSLPEYTFTSLP